MKKLWLVSLLFVSLAHAETPRSPYRVTWLFPDNADSAIDVDRGDLATSRFESDYELVRFMLRQPKPKKGKGKPGAEAVPGREMKIEQLDTDGKVRTTDHYVLQLAEWRKLLGERMVERLEDEFDAHLRMIFPHGPVKPVSPQAPPDLGAQ